MPYILYTWGYQSRSIGDLDVLIEKYNIDWIVDVRRRAWAQYQPAFRSSNLQQHFQQKNHASYKTLGRYLGNLHQALPWKKPTDWQTGIDQVVEMLDHRHNVLLLCLERDPVRCHRYEVAQAIQELTGYDVVHLGWPPEGQDKKKAKDKKKQAEQLTLF